MRIKIITLNVWHGGKLGEAMLEFLESQSADILLLQEAYNDPRPELAPNLRTLEVISKRLDYRYSDFAPTFTQIFPDVTAERGNGILSRFPITPTGNIFFNQPYSDHYVDVAPNFATSPRNLQAAEIHSPTRLLNVFNFQGVWDLDGDNYSPDRAQMSDKIISAISGLPNVILAGDTNAKPTNQAIIRIENHLTNIFRNELTTSFNMRRKVNPGYATAVVDMIFASSDLKLLSHSCPDVDISDHLPLVASFDV